MLFIPDIVDYMDCMDKIKQGGISMPTSSITRNFVIAGKDKVEAFVNALEESAKANVPLREVSARQLTDPKEIKALMMKKLYKKSL